MEKLDKDELNSNKKRKRENNRGNLQKTLRTSERGVQEKR